MWVQSLGRKDPLKEGVGTHSHVLDWRIPMDRGAWRLQSKQIVADMTERLSTHQC